MIKSQWICAALAAALFLGGCQPKAETPAPTAANAEAETVTEEASTSAPPTEAPTTEITTSEALNVNEMIDPASIGSADLPAPNVALFKEGVKAPDFSGKDRDGATVTLADFAGRTLVLNFWASWCPPCKMEMPDLNDLDKEWMRGGPVELLTINATDGQEETEQTATDFLDEYSYNFHVLFDTTLAIGNSYQLSGIPTTFIIKPDGTLYATIAGATEKSVIEALLEKMP